MPVLDASCPEAEGFGGTLEERAALCLAKRNEFVSARSLASHILDATPDSIRGHLVMGYAQHLGEANLPKALFHLEAAEKGLIANWGLTPERATPEWVVAYRVLVELLFVHGEMDHHEAKIRYADRITERFDIDYSGRKAWPLLKLKRFDEARSVAKTAADSDDPHSRAVGMTALCAVESELRNRDAAYQACVAAARPVLSSGVGGAVELSNAAAASEEVFRYDEAERYYLEATRRGPEGSVNPWGRLVRMYLRQGRLPEALSAWRAMRAYRARRAGAHLDQQDQAEADLIGAAVMMVAGRPEHAERITRRTVSRPDRQGTSSAASDQNEAGADVMDRVAKLSAARVLEARVGPASWSQALDLRLQAAQLRYSAWQSGRRAAEVLSNPERLHTTLRPECPGSVEMPAWLDAEVIALVGPGVALGAIAVARRAETLPHDLSEPIFLALEAEAYWRKHDDKQAVAKAQLALRALETSEMLRRGRVAALGADAAAELDEYALALRWYQIAISEDPTALRRLGLRLPVRLVGLDGSEAVEEALDILEGSPVFEVVDWGLVLQVGAEALRLVSPQGSVLTSVTVRAPEAEDKAPAESVVSRIVATAQEDLLSPYLDITQADVRSLDGSLGVGAKAGQQIDDILDSVKQSPQ